MEPISSSQPSESTPKKPSSFSKPSVSDQICTPEKPAQFSQRARLRNFALSVKEVRQAAIGLNRREQVPSASSDSISLAREKFSEKSPVETPVGVSSPSKKKVLPKLPKKYEMLCEFFNCLDSSIRLLRLKGSKTTFANIRASVQHLSERDFTYGHLAQLKNILPEAIVIKKVLLRDEVTCCMNPELQITLNVDGLGDSIKCRESGFAALRLLFRRRVVDFSIKHPEEDDIPGDELPHPFNQVQYIPDRPITPAKTTTEPSAASSSQQKFALLSHIPPSFQRRFSRKADTIVSPSVLSGECLSPAVKKRALSSPISFNSPKGRNSSAEFANMPASNESNTSEGCAFDSTPAKVVPSLHPMTETPKSKTPNSFCTEAVCNTTPLKKAEKRSTRTKLFSTPMKNTAAGEELNGSGSVSDADGAADDVLHFLPKSLLQSVRAKEKRLLDEKEAGIPDSIKRESLIASLPSTFNTILLTYQSLRRSVVAKKELVHRIISSNLKIVDTDEVEEQLKLLKELAPNWFSEKTSLNGDTLCCINTDSNPEDIRKTLYEAV